MGRCIDNNQRKIPIQVDDEGIFPCPLCPKEFFSFEQYASHARVHAGGGHVEIVKSNISKIWPGALKLGAARAR